MQLLLADVYVSAHADVYMYGNPSLRSGLVLSLAKRLSTKLDAISCYNDYSKIYQEYGVGDRFRQLAENVLPELVSRLMDPKDFSIEHRFANVLEFLSPSHIRDICSFLISFLRQRESKASCEVVCSSLCSQIAVAGSNKDRYVTMGANATIWFEHLLVYPIKQYISDVLPGGSLRKEGDFVRLISCRAQTFLSPVLKNDRPHHEPSATLNIGARSVDVPQPPMSRGSSSQGVASSPLEGSSRPLRCRPPTTSGSSSHGVGASSVVRPPLRRAVLRTREVTRGVQYRYNERISLRRSRSRRRRSERPEM
jgi:hypothetical protein